MRQMQDIGQQGIPLKKVKNHDKSHGLWGFFLLKLT